MISKRATAILTATATGLSLAAFTAAPASASTLGEQIAVSTYYSDKVYVCGDNQNNDYVCTPWFDTPGSGYTYYPHWWFKGTIYITGLNESNGTYYNVTCGPVPASSSSDIYYCDGRSNKYL